MNADDADFHICLCRRPIKVPSLLQQLVVTILHSHPHPSKTHEARNRYGALNFQCPVSVLKRYVEIVLASLDGKRAKSSRIMSLEKHVCHF